MIISKFFSSLVTEGARAPVPLLLDLPLIVCILCL